MTEKELKELSPEDYTRAHLYSWISFQSRNQLMPKKKRKDRDRKFNMIPISHPKIEEFERSQFSPEFLNQIQSQVPKYEKKVK